MSERVARVTSSDDEDGGDLAYGQHVIVTARWILVTAGLLLALWLPESVAELRIKIPVILLLAVGNFYLHAQLLRKRPVIDTFVYAASAFDLVVVTLIIASEGGAASDLYIFYFPAILGLSLAFPTVLTLGYTAIVIAAYAFIFLASGGTTQLEVLITRVVMFASIAACGNLYWRTERDRRTAATAGRSALSAELDARGAKGART